MASYPPVPPENGATFTSTIHGTSYPFIQEVNHKGHHILITGGARGIGRSIALSCARAGAKAIAVADMSPAEEVTGEIVAAAKEQGHEAPHVVEITLDVTDEESVRQCAKTIAAELGGRLDVLVNNAGFMTPALPVAESETSTWWRTLEVNLKGLYLTSKHLIPVLLASPPDALRTVVNTNSVAALNLRPMASAYGASKAAGLKLTEFLLVEAAPKGLLAYSVHPGAVRTKLARDGMPPETLAGLSDDVGLAGDTVCWLAAERREWLAGRYISCTWDMEELLGRKAEIVDGDKLKVRLV
ncbi:oxidoreductase-like protein, partial [Hypoxylon sp. FL1284]